jgi:hypothetical protein
MKRFNPKLAIAGILVVLVVFFAIFALFDWTINVWVNAPYVDSPERTAWNNMYWTILGVAMLFVGIFGAVLVKLVTPNRKVGTKLAIAVLFSTVVMVVGNLEDWLYYLLGQGSLPAWDSQANWLFQSKTISFWLGFNGSWTFYNLLWWSVIWILIVLPIGLVLIFKYKK